MKKLIPKLVYLVALYNLFILIVGIGAYAIDVIHSEPILNCSKPEVLYSPNPAGTNGIVNLFLGETARMSLHPQGPNYNSLIPITGSGLFSISDYTDGQSVFETVCSRPYGVSVGQLFYGGVLRYTLTEIEQIYGYTPGYLRVESTGYEDLDADGLWDPGEPVIVAPAFATFDMNLGQYTTPNLAGPMVDVIIAQQLPQVGNNATITAYATPPAGRGIQGIYLQQMPSGTISAVTSLCPPIGSCSISLTFTVNSYPQTFHVHTFDTANVGHAKAFQI